MELRDIILNMASKDLIADDLDDLGGTDAGINYVNM